MTPLKLAGFKGVGFPIMARVGAFASAHPGELPVAAEFGCPLIAIAKVQYGTFRDSLTTFGYYLWLSACTVPNAQPYPAHTL